MLAAERGAARNTLAAYGADLSDFAAFAAARGEGCGTAAAETVRAYMAGLHAAGIAVRELRVREPGMAMLFERYCRDGSP